jgi:hypothetical protein
MESSSEYCLFDVLIVKYLASAYHSHRLSLRAKGDTFIKQPSPARIYRT